MEVKYGGITDAIHVKQQATACKETVTMSNALIQQNNRSIIVGGVI
jgi:hypothetical protein